MRFAEDIIIRPLMTEKSVAMQDTARTYSFEVTMDANKISIKRAVEKLFEVSVKSVRVQRYKGKAVVRRLRRSRVEGRKKHWKKAIVTLHEGYDIDFFKDVM